MAIAEAIRAGITAFVKRGPGSNGSASSAPTSRDHSFDITVANVQLHREPTDPQRALHEIAVELSGLRAERDAARTDLERVSELLATMAKLVRR